MTEQLAEVPPHVPPQLVRDIDFYNLPDAEQDIHLAWYRVQQENPDIFWTPYNGGHWIATRAEDIDVMQLDHEHFSHKKFIIPAYETPFPSLPLDLDPPEHGPIRALISPAFSPRAVRELGGIARSVAVDLIEKIQPRGECEFVGDFAKVLPIVVFLGIVDLPTSDRELLLPCADVLVRSGDEQKRLKAHEFIFGYLAGWIEQRMKKPGSDLISTIVTSKVDGRPLSQPEIFGLTSLLLVGGFDTVAGMLSFTARHLAQHPEHRNELIANPELLPTAIEELMRRHGLPNTARLLTQHYEYKGIQFAKGDLIQLPKVLYNFDDRRIKDPLTVNFHRPTPIPNATFGAGPHKCPGANLARTEMRIFLEEWLRHIPEFEIKPGSESRTVGGMVNGLRELQLVWHV